MSLVVSRRLRIAWLALVLLGGLQSRAAAQVKLPLPAPGAEHPALFLRLMTRLCGELKKAAAAGALTRFVRGEELFKEGAIELVERSDVKVRQAHDGSWVLAGPLAVGARIDPSEMQAESTSCSAGNSSRLHESVQWASCALHASQGARCRLQVEEALSLRIPRRTNGEPSLEAMLPRRSFALTLAPSPRKPQRPARP